LAGLKANDDDNKKSEIEGLLAKDEAQYNLLRELAENHIKELLSKQKNQIIQFMKYISTEILARVQISNRKTCPD